MLFSFSSMIRSSIFVQVIRKFGEVLSKCYYMISYWRQLSIGLVNGWDWQAMHLIQCWSGPRGFTHHWINGKGCHFADLNPGPFLQTSFNFFPAWISKHMSSKMWDECTYPFLKFNEVISSQFYTVGNSLSIVKLKSSHVNKRGLYPPQYVHPFCLPSRSYIIDHRILGYFLI